MDPFYDEHPPREPRPRLPPPALGQTAPCRPTAPAAARRFDRTAALQRGRGCRAEAAAPPRGRAAPRPGSMSAAEGRHEAEKAPQWAKIGPRAETLSDRRPTGTPRRPPAGSQAPARAQPGPVSTLGGSERPARAARALRAASARRRGVLRAGTAPRGQPPPVSARTDGPLPAYSPRRRAQIAPPRSNGAGAAAPRPRRRPRAAPRRAAPRPGSL